MFENTVFTNRKYKLAYKILTSALAFAFVLVGTVAVVYYSRGYRIDRSLTVVERTGVLSIESDPFRVSIFINGKDMGRTPKTIPSLREGTYDVTITRPGYMSWHSKVEIVSEKSTPIYPHLFLVEPEYREVFRIDSEIVSIVSPEYSNFIFVTTRKELSSNVLPTPDNTENESVIDTDIPNQPDGFNENIARPLEDDETDVSIEDPNKPNMDATYSYKIWRYDISPSFWGAAQNPRLIYESDHIGPEALTLHPSQNGAHILLQIDTPTLNESVSTELTYNYDSIISRARLLNSNSRNLNGQAKIDIDRFIQGGYSLSWSRDNKYIVMESNTQIVSVDIANDTKYILSKGEVTDLTWSTDSSGNFYYLEYVDGSEDTPAYMRIYTSLMTGSAQEILVDRIFYSTDSRYLVSQESLIERTQPHLFSNSPINPQFAGKIEYFEVEKAINSVVIQTEFGLYLYDLDNNKYSIVSTEPAKYVRIAPDVNSFLFYTEDSLYKYYVDKQDADHTTKLGLNLVMSGLDDSNINKESFKWHNGSRVVFYRDGDSIKTIDSRTDNSFTLLEVSYPFYKKDNSGDNLFVITKEGVSGRILRARVN